VLPAASDWDQWSNWCCVLHVQCFSTCLEGVPFVAYFPNWQCLLHAIAIRLYAQQRACHHCHWHSVGSGLALPELRQLELSVRCLISILWWCVACGMLNQPCTTTLNTATMVVGRLSLTVSAQPLLSVGLPGTGHHWRPVVA